MAKSLKTPYTSVSDVESFFERVETIAEPKPPKKVDSAWVESYQFKTAHPSAIPSMLRWLGVIDDDGYSTGVWNELRVDQTRKTTLARLVKDAYSAVFDAVDVEKATARDLQGAFVSAYSIGDPGRQIKCFLSLCEQAGITTGAEAAVREPKQKANVKARPAHRGETGSRTNREQRRVRGAATNEPHVGITLSVEIPAGWSEQQIRVRVAEVVRALESSHADDS